MERLLPKSFYYRQPDVVARELLGKILVSCASGACMRCMVTEAEAYFGECDPASRARKGRGRIWRALYGEPGRALVYGMHRQWLLNIVAHSEGMAGAVLLRSCQPLEPHRLDPPPVGPGRLARALSIDRDVDGAPVYDLGSPLTLWENPEAVEGFRIACSGRVGVSEDLELPLRFYIAGNPFVSKARVSPAPKHC
ncbi:putative 3-methyladenine DNA glycosylase [Aeropyrum pernix]|uniref:Putative 3-methyladenine DNA glycosylase n=1 Tax=Aeropyrum pernix TaxID=56636 RepID=A0A401H7K9_AERPX|nr:DNA-3-methyladenine glycosylase [Aeropyrum pernix]GBF08289.1 putative 3-methyladenine DNA glycosylase [Aeropyrum pernix]